MPSSPDQLLLLLPLTHLLEKSQEDHPSRLLRLLLAASAALLLASLLAEDRLAALLLRDSFVSPPAITRTTLDGQRSARRLSELEAITRPLP